MVTLALAGLALAQVQAFSLETRLRAEAAPKLEIGAMAIGGNRTALLASVRRRVPLGEAVAWDVELLVGMRRTQAPQPGGPTAGAQIGWTVGVSPAVDAVAGGGWIPGIGGFGEAGVDARSGSHWGVHPRLRAGTWAGDRDLALRVEIGASYRQDNGGFVRASLGAGGRDTVHLGPGFTLTVGRSS